MKKENQNWHHGPAILFREQGGALDANDMRQLARLFIRVLVVDQNGHI